MELCARVISDAPATHDHLSDLSEQELPVEEENDHSLSWLAFKYPKDGNTCPWSLASIINRIAAAFDREPEEDVDTRINNIDHIRKHYEKGIHAYGSNYETPLHPAISPFDVYTTSRPLLHHLHHHPRPLRR